MPILTPNAFLTLPKPLKLHVRSMHHASVSSYRLLDIAAHIQERWAVSYGLSALSRMLHRMGLSWQTTRPAHPKGDAEAQARYKKLGRHARGRQRRPSRQDASAVA